MRTFLLFIITFILSYISTGSVVAAVDELPLPEIPDSIKEPAQRAEYVMLHFWDHMNFSDSTLTRNSDFLEQNFVNYIYLLPHVASEKRQAVVDNFLNKANVDEPTYSAIYKLAGTYLSNLDSPMRDEEMYILFLNHAVKDGKLGEAERGRAAFRLEMAKKNLPGTVAPDFRVITRDGKETHFLKLLKGDKNIVVFYDPDCGHCQEVLTELAENQQFKDTNIIGIDAEDDKLLWEQTASYLPESWEVGFSIDPIQDEDLYVFPEMPTIYLIASDGTIIIKEATLSNIVNKLQ